MLSWSFLSETRGGQAEGIKIKTKKLTTVKSNDNDKRGGKKSSNSKENRKKNRKLYNLSVIFFVKDKPCHSIITLGKYCN